MQLSQDKALQCLEELKEIASQLKVETLSDYLFVDARFIVCSGSSNYSQHHYGDHGLVIHTHEVVTTCLKMRELYSQYDLVLDKKELYLAALFHDAGKMWDYECVYGVWRAAEHKRIIHHITRSVIVWNEACLLGNIGDTHFIDQVTHAILAHHGQRAWGSPVAPKSRVAWLLHLCDGISARLYDAETQDVVGSK